MQVKDKVFVVTGGGSGMGRELVLGLLARGARVAAVDINEDSLDETLKLAKASANDIACYRLDITDKKEVDSLPQRVIAHFGSVDALINNAGIIQPFVRVNELNFDVIERVMNVNWYGSLFLIKAFLPHFIKRPHAHIVNLSSMGALVPVPGQVIYGASKAAIKLLTEGLISELSTTQVKISLVLPGAVKTNITTNSGVAELPDTKDISKADQKNKFVTADKAAQIILDGIERDQQRILVGKDVRFMDIFSRISPLRAAKLINKHMASLLE